MKDEAGERSWWLRWGLPVSVGLHVVAGALLLFDLPMPLPQPQEDRAIAVELVPPPEEDAKPEPPPAPAPEQPAAAKNAPAPATNDAAQRQPALRPVFQFGEKDAGPRQSPGGNSASDASPDDRPVATSAAETPATAPDQSENPVESEAQAATPAESDKTEADKAEPAKAEPDKVEPDKAEPGTTADITDDRQNGSPALTVSRDAGAAAVVDRPAAAPIPEPKPSQTPTPAKTDPTKTDPAKPAPTKPAPAKAAKAQAAKTPAAPALREATELFSQSASGDATATTAAGNLPRSVRGGRLCVSELREQLLRGSPPYFPDLLPSYPLDDGSVLDVPKAAFRMRGQWFNLSFRCTVDAQATKVVAFALRVGEPLPRSEWASRGLPTQ